MYFSYIFNYGNSEKIMCFFLFRYMSRSGQY
jgi:hypothetical protein